MQITHAVECQCGAFTLDVELDDESTINYSMTEETLEAKIGKDAISPILADQKFCNCNHCVNHWGVDLCACGSGETPEECENGLEMCGTPMQELGKLQRISMWR